MFCSTHARAIFLLTALTVCFFGAGGAMAQDLARPQVSTQVQLRWGLRPGVSRYRLQVSHDRDFADIVFDRVVSGNQIEINDLDPGRYFWRVAALTTNLGEFSSAGVIEVRSAPTNAVPRPDPTVTSTIVPFGGWRAAIGNISDLVTAHLRSPNQTDLLALNASGFVFAIDAASGVVLWTARSKPESRPALTRPAVLIVPTQSRLDNVVVLRGNNVTEIDGATGRELWRTALPAPASSGTLISDRGGARLIAIIDASRQQVFTINDASGTLTAQLKLPARLVGAPLAVSAPNQTVLALGYESGDLEIRDLSGALLRSANVGSPATTPPLFVRGRNGDLILLGTQAGLTALGASDLRALGRVAIPNDSPRGTLAAQDLDGDGAAEVIMATERGHLVAVNATDGKIIWDVPANDFGASLSFADLNGDRVLDVFISGDRKSTMAVSGNDGSILWKDMPASSFATNHAATSAIHDLVVIPYPNSVLLVAVEPSGTGLRALSFSNAPVRPDLR